MNLRRSPYQWLWIILVFLVAFWLRIHALDSYPPGISNDEAVNVVDSFHIHQTGIAPAYEDKGRPEPTYRIVTAVAMWAWGDTVWAARLSGAMWSMVTLAALYWLASEAMADADIRIRRIVGLAALVTMAIMIGHITFSRALYRAIPQLLFVTLSAGFVLRGLRTSRWRDFGFGGFFGAFALYSYPAAYFYPPALVILGLSLVILRLRRWRVWLPRMIFAACVAALVALPLVYLYLTNPDAILARAQDVASEQSRSWSQILRIFIRQFFEVGDENPQYNVALAPIIPPILQPIFYLGLLALIVRSLKPSTWFIVAMGILFALPVLASNEITHGLRVSSEYIVVAVIIGLGVATALHWLSLFTSKRPEIINNTTRLVIVALLGIAFYVASIGWNTYRNYWDNASSWKMWQIFGEELNHNEWFFRTDRRYFAEWITAQDYPILIPAFEVNRQTTRTWLLHDYPSVTTADRNFSLPDDTHIVVPYELGLGDLMRDTRDYALLDNGVITLLPPLSLESHQMLLDDIDTHSPIEGEGDVLTFWGYDKVVPADVEVEFDSPVFAASQPIAIFGDDEIHLTNWYGDTTIANQDSLSVTLNWTPTRQLRHEYQSVVQLQTRDFERVTGDDDFLFMQRWVYPSTMWQVDDAVPDTHQFSIPPDLPVGAYRLVAGVKYTNYPALNAVSTVGETVNQLATIGWVKVPQAEPPDVLDSAVAVDAQVANSFQLTHVEATVLDNGQALVHLYWRSLVQRPAIDATVFVHATDNDGNILAQNDARPWDGQYPTFIWDEGEVVRTEHLLGTEGLDIADLNMRVGMYVFPGPTNLEVVVDGVADAAGLIQLGALANYMQ